MRLLICLAQFCLLAAVAPLVSGFITCLKNDIRLRRGQSIWQPYYNLAKLFSKDEVISQNASWILRVTPYVVLAASLTALGLLSVFAGQPLVQYAGDLFLLIFLLALGRFFLALAGLDTGSAFTGMGSSREMFIASFAEPVVFLSVFAVCLSRGTTDAGNWNGFLLPGISTVVAAVALFLVSLAETSRIPVDNQETHLELTMIHEAMALEYSGRRLGILESAAHIKQIIFFTIIADCSLAGPFSDCEGWPAFGANIALLLLKIFGLAVITAVVEVSLAKMRLFRAVDFLTFAGMLSFLSVVTLALGL
jgi:formate hydrogenlyase subunit 4